MTKQENAPTYRYELRSTGHSSKKYGPCEVCGESASEVFYQSEQRMYTKVDGSTSWTHYGCNFYFGHKDCLKDEQRNQ